VLEIPLARITAIATARSSRELQPHLQGALELEFAVIPLYLTALFSLRDHTNEAIRSFLHGASIEKMLHVALIANVLNATGCSPILSGQRLARGYPQRLPLGATGVELSLRKFSPAFLFDVFVAFDQARASTRHGSTDGNGHFGSIGQFYQAIAAKFRDLGDVPFVGDPALQFVDAVSYSERELFRVSGAGSAIRALQLISAGTGIARDLSDGADPVASPDQLGLTVPGAWPEAVQFEPASVINIVENSRAVMYAADSPARTAVDTFNSTYCHIIADLDATFNGSAGRFEAAISNMYRLTSLARSIVAIEHGDGKFAAPSFEYNE
jgi:hypothetical protein